ncbi:MULTISPECIES: hypothetical protein [Paenibacillus]|uniref:Uncharacterized protein n=1 Tax=Paenibacillus azoreducens TaxID=116718 RepID=A0A920CV72_9BACL|nr:MULTISPECIES: hypothetical protein [Paenibacillus]MBE9917988.1 hypothetical protein [Paenibacillus donghaensis]GIO50128.1 hypothetical protein J34TS1_48930 [Paenibacillus azoreducens]
MSIRKAVSWLLEALRSVVFLMVGILILGAAERPLTAGGRLQPAQLLLLLAADLIILYVVHRKFIAQRRFYRSSEKPALSGRQTLILLGFAAIAFVTVAIV